MASGKVSDEVIDVAFRGTASRIKGVNFDIIGEETIRRHEMGYPSRTEQERLPVLPNYGNVHWRHNGERHHWNPFTIAELQAAARRAVIARWSWAGIARRLLDLSCATSL